MKQCITLTGFMRSMLGPPKKETGRLKLSGRKCAKLDGEDSNGMHEMFRMMVAYCERMMDMLGELWRF